MIKSEDIYQMMKKMAKVGWKALRESSINRIIYLSAVLYSFRYPQMENIFKQNYMFTVRVSGPEDAEIEKALTNLISNEVLEHTENGYRLCPNANFRLMYSEIKKKEQWFDDMSYIVGMYGEDKIFDFIFRDPEYRTSLKSNSTYNLNLDSDNATVRFLFSFKKAFEEKMDKKEEPLTNRKYLELYFEYIFGKILRGEK